MKAGVSKAFLIDLLLNWAVPILWTVLPSSMLTKGSMTSLGTRDSRPADPLILMLVAFYYGATGVWLLLSPFINSMTSISFDSTLCLDSKAFVLNTLLLPLFSFLIRFSIAIDCLKAWMSNVAGIRLLLGLADIGLFAGLYLLAVVATTSSSSS